MKKIVIFALLVVGLAWGSVNADACETVRFLNGESFCFGIERLSNNQYLTKLTQSTLTSSLTCKLILPNLSQVALPGCQGNFSYAGTGLTLKLAAEIRNYTADIIFSYNFLGDEIPPLEENDLASLQITSITPTNPTLSEWIGMTLKVYDKQNKVFSTFEGKLNFSVEEYRNGSWKNAYSPTYSLSSTSTNFSTLDRGSKTLSPFLRFNTEWKYRFVVTTTYNGRTVSATQIFEFSKTPVVDPENKKIWSLQIISVTPSAPKLSDWITASLRVFDENNKIFIDFDGRVDFSVEEYRNGSRQNAYHSDYTLSLTSNTFSSSDRGEKRYLSLLRFSNEWKYRLVATTSYKGKTATATQVFEINKISENSNPSYDQASSFEIYKTYPYYPIENQWIDLSLRVYDRYGYLLRDYDGFLNVEVEKRVNGSWRSASRNDFRLDAQTLRFYSSDRGDTTFKSMISFTQAGEYKLKIIDRYDASLYDTMRITVDTRTSSSNNNSYYSEFTDKELKKLRAIYQLWPQVIILLKKDYPRLRNNSTWQKMSDDFYQNMRDTIYSDRGKFRYFDDFYQDFMEWFSYTSRVR